MDFKKHLIDSIFSAYRIHGEDYIITIKIQNGTYIRKPINELSNDELKKYSDDSILSDVYKDIANDVILKRRIKLINKIKKHE